MKRCNPGAKWNVWSVTLPPEYRFALQGCSRNSAGSDRRRREASQPGSTAVDERTALVLPPLDKCTGGTAALSRSHQCPVVRMRGALTWRLSCPWPRDLCDLGVTLIRIGYTRRVSWNIDLTRRSVSLYTLILSTLLQYTYNWLLLYTRKYRLQIIVTLSWITLNSPCE